jgi:hypothetical protein
MTIEGYIIDFIIKLSQYFSREEKHFFGKGGYSLGENVLGKGILYALQPKNYGT